MSILTREILEFAALRTLVGSFKHFRVLQLDSSYDLCDFLFRRTFAFSSASIYEILDVL